MTGSTWWFDHHQSAFLTPEDESIISDSAVPIKIFSILPANPAAEFIARIAEEKFDFEDETLDDLIHWAHIIDGALYESPAQCVELRAPALKLMQVIEGENDPAFRRNDHSPPDRAKHR